MEQCTCGKTLGGCYCRLYELPKKRMQYQNATISKIQKLAADILQKSDSVFFEESLLHHWDKEHYEAQRNTVVEELNNSKTELNKLIAELGNLKL